MIHPDATVDECMEEIGSLEREIERLRKGAEVWRRGCDRDAAEIERLTALNAELVEMFKQAHVMALSAVNICNEAIAKAEGMK